MNRTIARCIGCGGGGDNIESLQHSYRQSKKMDDSDMGINLTAEEVEENTNMNEINDHSGDERMVTYT